MIDAEKLLGKVLSGAIQSGGKKKKKKKKKKSDDLMDSVLGSLTSGKGLVTAIGLGVGAYEIMRSKKAAAQPAQGSWGGPSQHSAPVPPVTPAAPPTPPPVPGQGTPAVPPTPAAVSPSDMAAIEDAPAADELATLLIQTMVAAAHADGQLDHDEEEQILKTLQEQGLDAEEKRFIITQLHAPKSIVELTVNVEDPTVAHTMYSLACSTIVVDTEEERQWLDQFAAALSISKAMQSFLEEDA